MYSYLIPLYWVADFRVKTNHVNDYVLAPVCLLIDSKSGSIVSYSFSYGLAKNGLNHLASLALWEKNLRKSGGVQMYKCSIGDVAPLGRRLTTDNYALSLDKLRHPRPSTYDWSKAGMLLKHLFYDWNYFFYKDLGQYNVLSQEKFIGLLAYVVYQFNQAVIVDDIGLEGKGGGL